MNHLFNQLLALLAPRHLEYVALDDSLKIIDTSLGVQRFADRPEMAIPGQDVRIAFPEIIGIEDSFKAIFQGKLSNFNLKGIARSSEQNHALYINMYVLLSKDEKLYINQLIVLFEDVTETMILQQQLIQSANEANLLLSRVNSSEKYIKKIISSMGDALLVTTNQGNIKTINQAAIELFGYSEEELIKSSILMIIDDPIFILQATQTHPFSEAESLKNVEVICNTKSGKQITVAFSCSAIESDIVGELNYVYIGRDITLAKLAQAEILQALAKERELNEFKSRFVSMVSHEFGNPINTIIMSVELLKIYSKQTNEKDKSEYINYIQIAARQMAQLLKDVLLIGKSEAGRLDFELAPLDLVKFCRYLVEQIKLSTGCKEKLIFNHTPSSEFEQSSCISVEEEKEQPLMDEKLLRHILTNLLSNAVKYSPQGGNVYFNLSSHNGEAIFQIKDEGIGIPPADQKQLFQSFHRAKNVGKIPGTGLGLAIVKQCVDLHAGTIDVSSEVGVGTTFTVKIPLNNRSLINIED